MAGLVKTGEQADPALVLRVGVQAGKAGPVAIDQEGDRAACGLRRAAAQRLELICSISAQPIPEVEAGGVDQLGEMRHAVVGELPAGAGNLLRAEVAAGHDSHAAVKARKVLNRSARHTLPK